MMRTNNHNYVVYCHTSPSGKSYIGITNDYKRRSSTHKSMSRSNCSCFKNAIKKYGWENFKHEILMGDLSIDLAKIFERHFILEMNTMSPNGYNLTTGGESHTVSKETRDRISKANTGKKISQEHRQKLIDANIGRRVSDTTRLKMSSSRKKYKMTEEQKKKISESMKGRVVSEDTREKLAKARIGKVASESLRESLSNGQKKRFSTKEGRDKQSESQKRRFKKDCI